MSEALVLTGADAGLPRRPVLVQKLPKEIRFVASQDDFPRSTSGKVQRRLVERWLDAGKPGADKP
jgi:acyl-CoA synthetase (AMP-forming)/AMP-acid ligase II